MIQEKKGYIKKIDLIEHLSKNRETILLYNLDSDLSNINDELVKF